MPASLRAPDITEDNPDPALPRSVRLHNMIRFQLRGNDAVCLLHWISTSSSDTPGGADSGFWAAWINSPASKEDPLRQANVGVPAEIGVHATAG